MVTRCPKIHVGNNNNNYKFQRICNTNNRCLILHRKAFRADYISLKFAHSALRDF